jgi:hypothetical protein
MLAGGRAGVNRPFHVKSHRDAAIRLEAVRLTIAPTPLDDELSVDWPYIHLLLNHFPIILSVVGTAVLILALITRRRSVWLYAVATLTLAGVSIYPTYYTGDAAAHALRSTWYVVRSMVNEHEESADYALVSVLVVGAVSAYAWWRILRRDAGAVPPVWVRTLLTVLAVFSLAIVVRTAYLGGKIVHESPKLRTPPAGATPGPRPASP